MEDQIWVRTKVNIRMRVYGHCSVLSVLSTELHCCHCCVVCSHSPFLRLVECIISTLWCVQCTHTLRDSWASPAFFFFVFQKKSKHIADCSSNLAATSKLRCSDSSVVGGRASEMTTVSGLLSGCLLQMMKGWMMKGCDPVVLCCVGSRADLHPAIVTFLKLRT